MTAEIEGLGTLSSSASNVTAFLKAAALGNSILDYDKFLDSGGEIDTIADISVGVGRWSQVTTTEFEGLDKQFVEMLYDHDLFSPEQIDFMYELGEEPHAKAEAFAQAEIDAYRALEELWGRYIPRLWYPIRYRDKPGLLLEVIPNACSVFELFGYDIEDDKCVIKGADIDPAIFSQAEEALAAVHAHGFLHGDVDTRNIVVSQDDMHVFFVDFQCAREASQNERDEEMKKMKSLSARAQRLYEAAMKGTFPNVFDFIQ